MPDCKKSSSEEEYSLLMDSLGVSVSKHLLDEHFTVVWANDNYYKTFGYTKEEYETLFHNRPDLYYKDDPEDWAELTAFVSGVFATGARRYEHVCRMRHRNGNKLWIKLVSTMTDEIIEGCHISYSVMVDITEQMQLQVEQSVTYSNMPGPIAKYKVTETGFQRLDANQRYFEMFQNTQIYSLAEMTAETGLEEAADAWTAMRQGAAVCFTISPPRETGRLHMRCTGTCLDWDGPDPVFLLIYDDVTQLTDQRELLKEQNAKLERLAFCDEVTGGMNRARFEMVAGEAIRSAPAGTYTLVWVNVDKFKLINEMAGTAQGDRTLRYIHNVLAKSLSGGEFVARIASDNYALLLRSGPDPVMVARLGDMAQAVNRFNDGRKYKYILSFTAGLYRVEEPELEITRIQDRANVARQGAQGEAAGLCLCRIYSDQERQHLLIEKDIENRMRTALKEGQFQVYLQPKLSLKDDTVAGAEALVRWNDPENGLIPPDRFIPLFEKNGFILPLDRYVFEEVCKLLRRWLDRGLTPVPISVNVSRAHFSGPNFVDSYRKICKKYDVPPALLEIEVTETVVFQDPSAFSQIVEQIHRAGFTCSMDDFGSGYSSLNVLKDIEVDTLKLDKAFFASPEMDDQRERDVVTTVIDLAKKLNIEALAEGVETAPQRDFLKASDCDLIQGYVFSKPIPIDAFEKLVFGQ